MNLKYDFPTCLEIVLHIFFRKYIPSLLLLVVVSIRQRLGIIISYSYNLTINSVNFDLEFEGRGERILLSRCSSNYIQWCGLVVDTVNLEVGLYSVFGYNHRFSPHSLGGWIALYILQSIVSAFR